MLERKDGKKNKKKEDVAVTRTREKFSLNSLNIQTFQFRS